MLLYKFTCINFSNFKEIKYNLRIFVGNFKKFLLFTRLFHSLHQNVCTCVLYNRKLWNVFFISSGDDPLNKLFKSLTAFQTKSISGPHKYLHSTFYFYNALSLSMTKCFQILCKYGIIEILNEIQFYKLHVYFHISLFHSLNIELLKMSIKYFKVLHFPITLN